MRRALACLCCIALATPGGAAPFADYDRDGDGYLNVEEQQHAAGALDMSESRLDHVRLAILAGQQVTVLAAPENGLLVSDLNARFGASYGACAEPQTLFIRADIADASIARCQPASADGARFSFNRDIEAGTSTGTFDLAIAYRLTSATDGEGGAVYPSILAFASADGRVGDGANFGQVRAGAIGSFRWGNGDTNTLATVAPYRLTDIDFRASGFGLDIDVLPENASLRLNARNATQSWHLLLQPSFEYLRVDEAGVTGFADDTEYAYARLLTGVAFALPASREGQVQLFPFGATGRVTYDGAVDLISGDGLGQYAARIQIPLESRGRVGVEFGYSRGNTPEALQFQQTADVSLFLRF